MSEIVELSVEALGAQGDGIARWHGETVFVPFAAPGDRVRARLGARRGQGREARVVERLALGQGRAEPVCRHFGRCGGCALQHLDGDAYRALKLAALHGALRRIGIDPAVVAPLREVPPGRRRARLGLRPPALAGFRERFSHALVDLEPFPPGAFLQASAAAEAALVAEVTAAIGGARPVLDLYAGLGTFAFALGGGVHAVEGNAAAAAAMAAAAAPGITVERRDLERDPLPVEALARYAAAVFDPPRAGARRQAERLAASAIPTIVAVSCNPATFARDAARLIAGGYRLERVAPVDQFVWTPHLELVAVFRR